MNHPDTARLRLLCAEIRAELPRLERTVAEIAEAHQGVSGPESPRLFLYAAAALLETYYSAIEKTLARIASTLAVLPDGPAWHRRLLEEATLDLPKIRPPVLSCDTARRLDPYLAFRHRFRNFYLFDLDPSLVIPLLEGVPSVARSVIDELSEFAVILDRLADALDS